MGPGAKSSQTGPLDRAPPAYVQAKLGRMQRFTANWLV